MATLLSGVDDAIAKVQVEIGTVGNYLRRPVLARTIMTHEAETGIIQNMSMITGGVPENFKNTATPGYCTTLEGNYPIKAGDYLILGANGEVYPTPKSVFESTRDANPNYVYETPRYFDSTEIVKAILIKEDFSVIGSNGTELFSKDTPYWLIEGPISGLRPCHLQGFEIYDRI